MVAQPSPFARRSGAQPQGERVFGWFVTLLLSALLFCNSVLAAEFCPGRVYAVSPALASLNKPAASGCTITDRKGGLVKPGAVLSYGTDIYLLDTAGLWRIVGGMEKLKRDAAEMSADYLESPGRKVGRIPIHEFNNFVLMPGQSRPAIAVLDKSGDVFSFDIRTQSWDVCRPNRPITGQPDPDFLDLASTGYGLCILDPERNQIWQFACNGAIRQSFKEVLPWRLQPGDITVADGIAIAFDRDAFVLKRNGVITRYGDGGTGQWVQKPFYYQRPRQSRPSRLITAPGTPLFVVERQNNRVLAINKHSQRVSSFNFSEGSNLRGLIPQADGFYVLNGSTLQYRKLSEGTARPQASRRRGLDPRLDGLTLPVPGVRLPRHPGVWPGARRLYRYGVHAGVDFFDDRGCGARVIMGTPVEAADTGKVIRADGTFCDMNARQFQKVMQECLVEHTTSESNEDLFRGCQVWIDHGNGLITRYAHLSKIKDGLKVGDVVNRGAVIGYVGVSGTGQNLPGRAKHPHLHFEIWLDGKYLGWGLTPGETIGIYEDIFGTSCDRSDS